MGMDIFFVPIVYYIIIFANRIENTTFKEFLKINNFRNMKV